MNKYGIDKVLCIIYFILINSTSFVVFDILQGKAQNPWKNTSNGTGANLAKKGLRINQKYLYYEVSQMSSRTTPLRRARRDDSKDI